MNKLPLYPANHPVALALVVLAKAMHFKCDPFPLLEVEAKAAGLPPDSDAFDEAAELIGSPYCRELDLYLDRATQRKAQELGRVQGSSIPRVLLMIPT